MKLASLKSGRDGRLVVVADDLATAADAGEIAPTISARCAALVSTLTVHATAPWRRIPR